MNRRSFLASLAALGALPIALKLPKGEQDNREPARITPTRRNSSRPHPGGEGYDALFRADTSILIGDVVTFDRARPFSVRHPTSASDFANSIFGVALQSAAEGDRVWVRFQGTAETNVG